MKPDDPSPLELGQAAAARLGGGDWQLDAEPAIEPDPPAEPPVPPPPVAVTPRSMFRAFRVEDEVPPAADQIVEAMLFAGGPPLTAERAGSAIRGLTPEAFRAAVDRLAGKYRAQRRPYAVRPRDDGFALVLRPEFRGVKERMFGGPREARLTPPALDVLSLVAYRQPLTKPEVDALRGADCGALLRQLVRLGLVAVARRAGGEGGGVCYGTTLRFLELFGLASLDDLPRLADGPT